MPMGLKALTRELHADERPQLLAHLLALDEEDRRLRFAHALSDDGVRHYVESIDLSRDAVFVVTDANLAIVGAAHLAREDGQAELGMSVLPQNRGHGVGGALLERCTARARNWGVRVMFMNCLVENAAMMHLARKQDLKIAVSGAEAEAFVRLRRADLTSLAADAVAEHLGLFDHAQKSYWLALQAQLPP
jgi:GNAT superfamily N-acetyltransferase